MPRLPRPARLLRPRRSRSEGATGDGARAEESLGRAVAELLPEEVLHASFDPVPPEAGAAAAERRWWGHHVAELRWQAELARLVVDPVFRGRGVPHGDGRPVLLIPGFLAADTSLAVLGGWLRRIGHQPHYSGIRAANVDCSDRLFTRLERRVERLAGETGRKVAVLGHSRGGHFAKALSTRRPDLVERAVTMGAALDTPFDVSIPTKAMIALVRRALVARDPAARSSGCLTDTCSCPYTRAFGARFPADVPLTSIYSRADGVVWWEACRVPYARNVEVRSSHVGLAFNRHAYREIAAALAP